MTRLRDTNGGNMLPVAFFGAHRSRFAVPFDCAQDRREEEASDLQYMCFISTILL
ncbi:MAG: hypothetical protein ABIA92_04505 [Patescibacteria group bacterium]